MNADGTNADTRDPRSSTMHEEIEAENLEVEWIERLFVACCEMPVETTVQQAVERLIRVAYEVWPDAAIGVRISGEILVSRGHRPSTVHSMDPFRMFPEHAQERIVPIPYDGESFLHLAGDNVEPFSPGHPRGAFADRLAWSLGIAVRNCDFRKRYLSMESEMRALESRLVHYQKLASLGQIAAGIIHELNNPLTLIVANSELLYRKAHKGLSFDASDVDRMARINEAADRVHRFSRDLIDYSRPAKEEYEPVSVHDIIDRALRFCEHVFDEVRVTVAREFGSIRVIRGNSGQLTQVFVNLFTNAAQAMKLQGGCLSISTSMSSDGALVSTVVQDEGHGIDIEDVDQIFEPFFTKRIDGSGTGLGLSIVRDIVDKHGGRIRVARRLPKGAIFHVDLPVFVAPNKRG